MRLPPGMVQPLETPLRQPGPLRRAEVVADEPGIAPHSLEPGQARIPPSTEEGLDPFEVALWPVLWLSLNDKHVELNGGPVDGGQDAVLPALHIQHEEVDTSDIGGPEAAYNTRKKGHSTELALKNNTHHHTLHTTLTG